jgi:hypothetical protein
MYPGRAGFRWGEEVRFFWSLKYSGSANAASTKIPLLRARFQRAIGLGRGISRSAHFVNYLVVRRVVLRFCVCVKSAMLCHIFVGPAPPTPTPVCPSRGFGRKYFGARAWGSQTPVSKVLRSEAARSKSTNQPKQARAKAQLSPPRTKGPCCMKAFSLQHDATRRGK